MLIDNSHLAKRRSKMPEQRGKMIVLEGGDGSGKATQVELLRKKICLNFFNSVIDFPRYKDTYFGAILRRCLDGEFGDPVKINAYLASLPYAMDRFESRRQLFDMLNRGLIVIADRYHSANIIHQCAKFILASKSTVLTTATLSQMSAFIDYINHTEFAILKNVRPDKIIYLHVPPAVAQQLMDKQGRKKDEHENNLEYAKAVERAALWACDRFDWSKITCCPDGKTILPPEEIHQMIWDVVEPFIT